MKSNVYWTCKDCGAQVPIEQFECPDCKKGSKPLQSDPHPGLRQAERRGPSWVLGISFPTAILGLVAFFLPWVQISCGPLRFRFSGYEIATGRGEEKLDKENLDAFWRRLELERAKSRKGPSAREPREQRPQSKKPPQGVPLLWIVPAASALLAILALLGLPKVPAVLVSLLSSSYLAYFGVSSEQDLSNPRNTGGILTHDWLAGFWATWAGLIVPMVVALIRPRRQ